MSTLASYKDIHKNKTIIVCGCGESLKELYDPARYITIGVNDVGRLFNPTYLLVLNPKHQFKGNRFHYVETSRAKVIFSQLKLDIKHPKLIQFKLGERSGTGITNQDALPYTRNSPYVAVCLAAYMGARRIGLIGVDFTDNHFFANTGKHPLSKKLKQIDQEYAGLVNSFQEKSIELINLSSVSRLKSIPCESVDHFYAASKFENQITRKIIKQKNYKEYLKEISMKIIIERRQSGIVGDFLDEFSNTASSLGYDVSRKTARSNKNKNVICVVWNGRHFHSTGPVLYCEHGWLPRWDYQISSKGINADSHVASFRWDGKPIDENARQMLTVHMDNIRKGGPKKYDYMQTDVDAVKNIPEAFLLVPFQMEQDTNILRHVPVRYRRMQALIDDVSKSNPPIPVIFKQHPADVKNANRQLRLRAHREQDLIWRHNKGNIHQLLKSGNCKGIISLNSNVVHDGLVWDVPSIVLGSNIWPKDSSGPFHTKLPENWNAFLNTKISENDQACKEAYAYYLMQNQWSMESIKDKDKVAAMLLKVSANKKIKIRSKVANLPVRSKPVINIVAKNLGWLFEDIKKHFLSANIPSVTIRASERALTNADAWIYLRCKEAVYSPDPSRTVVHIHDMFNADEYKQGGTRYCVNLCGGIVLTHPGQRQLLFDNGVDIESKRLLEKPVGASPYFKLKTGSSAVFTIAWIGRPTLHNKQDIKRVDWFVKAMKQLRIPVRVIFVGERLDKQLNELMAAGIDCLYYERKKFTISNYPDLYQNFDCVVVTAEENSRQSCLFEALATGVPVISTNTAWASQYIKNNENGFLTNSIDEIVEAVNAVFVSRNKWFDNRQKIRGSVSNCMLDDWLKDNISLSMALLGYGEGQSKIRKSSQL